MDITDQLDVIENSLRMLPAWSVSELRPEDQPIIVGTPEQPSYVYRDPGKWWERFAEVSEYGHGYLHQKLAGIMTELRSGQPLTVSQAASYLLMFFDNPALHDTSTLLPTIGTQRWPAGSASDGQRLSAQPHGACYLPPSLTTGRTTILRSRSETPAGRGDHR
jgi:hypothetical protein